MEVVPEVLKKDAAVQELVPQIQGNVVETRAGFRDFCRRQVPLLMTLVLESDASVVLCKVGGSKEDSCR